MIRTICYIIIFNFLFLLSACRNEKDTTPDVSKIQLQHSIVRFEKELFESDTANLQQLIINLKKKYPRFSALYFEKIISLTDNSDTIDQHVILTLRNFITDASILKIYNKTKNIFPESEFMNGDLKKSIQFMKYYFPEESEPVFYTLISEFAYGNFIFQDSIQKDGIGIGLDFFLGSEFNYKNINPENPAFSDYLNRSFNKDHLLKKTWEVWIEDHLSTPDNGRMIDYIIQRGKKLYALKKILPAIHDTVLYEYSAKQLQWCNKNQVEIWAFFLSKNLLYSTELIKINKYVNPAPVSMGMPEQSPGQTGNYIGYQIIKAYMKKHPDLSLKELWSNSDSQMILNESRFKPHND